MITSVIFDMDGTLIDTEKYYRIFWPMALEEFGYHMTDEQALSMRSLGRPFAPARLKEMFGDQVDYAAVRRRRKELMEPWLEKEGVELKPGAVELLTFLREKKILTAVATANDEERTAKYLGELGLLHLFDRIVCATMVKEGKPSPDIYLYACEQLGQNPGDCLAVEDSPNGVMSAYRAGCKVVMVPDLTQPDEELSAMLYAKAENLSQIADLLEGCV